MVDSRERGRIRQTRISSFLLDKEEAAEQHPLVIERAIGRPVGTDGGLELLHSLLPSRRNSNIGGGPFTSRRHRSDGGYRRTRPVLGLQQNRQYD